MFGLGLLLVIVALVSGSVPYGLLISRARGIDIRQVGSGNIGATNAARALGKGMGALVLLLDILKGLLPVLLARALLDSGPPRETWIAMAMLAAVAGHMFTPFLRFRGGKGVATGLGVFFGVSPFAALCGLGTYAIIYAIWRISSMGSLIATLTVPFWMWLFHAPRESFLAGIVICVLILIRHHANIKRLIRGEEGKV